MGVEQSAQTFYSRGSHYFRSNAVLCALLDKMASEEAFHYETLRTIADTIQGENFGEPASVALSDELRCSVISTLEDGLAKLESSMLTENDLYDCILRTEFAEWNDLFVYVISHALSESKLNPMVSEIQKHLTSLEHFLLKQDLSSRQKELAKLPRVWKHKVLVVDDEFAVREMLVATLTRKGYIVETAAGGRSALQKVQSTYYDAIISDISMPDGDGLELLESLSDSKSFNKEKILFISAGIEHEEYLQENKLEYLSKPFDIRQMTILLEDIVLKPN